MSVFLKSLLYAAVICGISASVVGKAYEKHIRMLCALLCTALVATPLLKLLPGIKLSAPEMSSAEYTESTAEYLITRQAEEDAEKAAAEYILQKTGIKPHSVCIQIESKEQTLYISAVSVTVSESAHIAPVKDCIAVLFEGIQTEVSVKGA